MPSLKKRVKKLAGRVPSPSPSAVADAAKDWLDEHAPSLADAGEAAVRVTKFATPGPWQIEQTVDYLKRGPSGFLGPLQDLGRVGHGAIEEPGLYGISKLPGVDAEAGGPFSGRQRKAFGKAAETAPGPLSTVAQASLGAADLLTDPSVYLPGLGFAGRGVGIGGAALRAGAFGAGAHGAAALGKEIGGTPGELVGGVLGGPVVLRAGRAAGLLGATDASLARGAISGTPTTTPERRLIKRLAEGTRDERGMAPTGAALRLGVIGAGAGFGYLTGETEDERRERALIGAGVGAGLVGATAIATSRASRRTLNSIVAPSANWSEDVRTPILAREGTVDAARMEITERTVPAMRGLEETILAAIPDAPPPGSRLAGRIASLPAGDPRRAELQALWRSVPQVIERERDYRPFLAANPTARAALDELKQLRDDHTAREVAAGLAYTQRRRYVPHVFAREVGGGSSAVHIGGKQFFQHDRRYGSYEQAIMAGVRPATLSAAELFGLRLLRGHEGMADQALVQSLAAVPDGIISQFDPRYPTSARDRAYRVLDDPTRLHLPDSVRATARKEALDALRARYGGVVPVEVEKAITEGRVSFALRRDLADALEVAFAPETVTRNPFWGGLKEGMDSLRTVSLGGDAYMATRSAIVASAASIQAAVNLHPNLRGPGMLVTAFRAGLQPGFYDDWARTHFDRRQFWTSHNLGLPDAQGGGTLLERKAGDSAIARFGKTTAGKVTVLPWFWQAVEGAQFERMIPVLKVQTADLLLTVARRAAPGVPDELLAPGVANFVDAAYGGGSRVKYGISANRAVAESYPLYTPRFQRALVHLGAVYPLKRRGAGAEGIEGALARGFWGRGVLGLMATGIGASLFGVAVDAKNKGEEDQIPDRFRALLDPRSPESLVNPTSRNFGKVMLPTGGSIDLLGNMRTLARTMLRPVAGGVGEGVESYDKNPDLFVAVGAGIGSFLQGLPAAYAWIENRYNPIIGSFIDATRNEDFGGRPITIEEDAWRRLRDKVLYGIQSVAPGVVQAWKADDAALAVRPGPGEVQVNLESTTQGLVESAGAFLGVFPILPKEHPASVKTPIARFLKEHGVDPWPDPVQAYRRDSGIPRVDREQFESKTPAVRDYLHTLKQESAEQVPQPIGRDAVRVFNGKRDELRQTKEQALAALDREFSAPGSTLKGPDFRRRRGEIMGRYHDGVLALGRSYLGANDYTAINARLEQTYREGKPEESPHPVDRALSTYESLEPVDGSLAAMDAFLRRRRAYLQTGELRDGDRRVVAQFDQGTMRQLREHLLTRPATPAERAYQQALVHYGEYVDIPVFLGLSAEQGRAALQLRSRARDRQRLQPGLNLRTQIMLDTQADADTKALALLTLNGKLNNPERAVYWQRHGSTLGRFFSDLLQQEIDALTDQGSR